MKFRMAKNSLFAILLRSPWWVSYSTAVVLTLAAMAFLPSQLAPYGASAGLPFLVIGTIAAFRQWGAPSRAEVTRTIAALRAMPWREFSAYVEEGFRRKGYTVERIDQDAAEFELVRDGQRAVVSCRRWKAASHGIEALQRLKAAGEARSAPGYVYIALSAVSENAQRYAREHSIDVLQDQALVHVLGIIPATRKTTATAVRT